MGIETAFLIGVLVGQWLVLLAVWRAVMWLAKLLALYVDFSDDKSPIGRDIIDIPSVENRDFD